MTPAVALVENLYPQADFRSFAWDLAEAAAQGKLDPWRAGRVLEALHVYDDARAGRNGPSPYEHPSFVLHQSYALVCVPCGRAFLPNGEAIKRHAELSDHRDFRPEPRAPWKMPSE